MAFSCRKRISVFISGQESLFYDYKIPGQDTAHALAAQKPVLVFIHGLGDEADTWRHIIPIMGAKGYRCIAPDLYGFGRSHLATKFPAQCRGRISLTRHAKTVIQLMAQSGINADRPAVLIGSSMGCGIAQLIAAKKPELVQAMVLIDGCFPSSGKVNKGLLFLCLPVIGKRWYRSFRKNHEAAWKSLYPYYYNIETMSEEDKQFLRKRVIARVESENQVHGYFASLRSMVAALLFSKKSLSRRIKQFSGKLLLVWGEHDHIMPVENTAVFRALQPGAILKNIADAGHLPHQEKPQETAEAILDFLAE